MPDALFVAMQALEDEVVKLVAPNAVGLVVQVRRDGGLGVIDALRMP